MAKSNVSPLFAQDHVSPNDAPQPPVNKLKQVALDLWQREAAQRLLWVPVLWALGAGIYFAMPFEPPVAAAIFLAAICTILAILVAPARRLCFAVMLALFGFCAAQIKTHWLQQPLTAAQTTPITLFATVQKIDRFVEGGVRLHLAELGQPGSANPLPKKIRLTIRTQTPENLSVGARISVRAVLLPLPRPAIAGGYEFGRKLYLDGYGATGFAVSAVTLHSVHVPVSPLAGARSSIETAIDSALDGSAAGLAKALLLGEKTEIPQDVRDAYRQAGLAHLLAISGLHMALVAGFVFFLVRRGLALSSRIALLLPLKSYAAGLTILALLGYLALVGAPISAQRATIMAICVMVAIMVGRSAISLRTAAFAAIALLALWPENIVDIGFQMSFAAVIALISGYEATAKVRNALRERLSGVGGTAAIYVAGVFLSTILAEIAIFPLSLYHFNEITVYGLAGNAFAVPITGFWIMPMGIIGVLLTPFGLSHLPFTAMGWGLDIVTTLSQDIASAPGAYVPMQSPSTLSLLVFFAGGLWLCLWKTKLRLGGLPLMVIAPVFAFNNPQPTLLVSSSGTSLVIETQQGGYVRLKGRNNSFASTVWARQLGIDAFLGNAKDYQRCDALGCSLALVPREDKSLVAQPLAALQPGEMPAYTVEYVKHPAALREACRAGAAVIIAFETLDQCSGSAATIGIEDLRDAGPFSIRLTLDMRDGYEHAAPPTPASRPSAESAALGSAAANSNAYQRTAQQPGLKVVITPAVYAKRPWHPAYAASKAASLKDQTRTAAPD
jgi:competence protein ComEC